MCWLKNIFSLAKTAPFFLWLLNSPHPPILWSWLIWVATDGSRFKSKGTLRMKYAEKDQLWNSPSQELDVTATQDTVLWTKGISFFCFFFSWHWDSNPKPHTGQVHVVPLTVPLPELRAYLTSFYIYNIFNLFCMSMYAYMCEGVGAHVCSCVWRPKDNLGCQFSGILYFFRQHLWVA